MNKPIINILTRTSGRPNAFKQCVDSINSQAYDNINHMIITDDEVNFDYIHKYYNDGIHLVDREALIKNDKSVNPNTGVYSPHNLYFNGIKDYVKDGWVIYLDDDDYLIDNMVILDIVNEINLVDEDTIIYWRMLYGNGNVLPIIIDDTNPPKLGGIGSPCFTYNTKYLDGVIWDGWKCADFRVVSKLHNTIPNYKWVPKNMAFIPIAGMGNKKDV